MQMVKISEQDLNRDDQSRANRAIDSAWLQHVGVDNLQFMYHEMREES